VATVKVKTTGVIFDKARREGVLKAGIAAGTKKLLPKVERVVIQKLNFKNATGRYERSISSKVYDSGLGVVRSTDKIKRKTFLETGVRSGVKTKRKGSYAWRAGKSFVRSEQKQGYYENEIARRLNG
jgi:hypothetical protein